MSDYERVKPRQRLVKVAIACLCALVVAAIGVSIYWDNIAVWLAPKKLATTNRSSAAVQADELFWTTFHNGEYDKIAHALEVLTAAYLETPTDAVTAAHIAWLHTWRITENVRLESLPASITDDAVLARKYFQEAV